MRGSPLFSSKLPQTQNIKILHYLEDCLQHSNYKDGSVHASLCIPEPYLLYSAVFWMVWIPLSEHNRAKCPCRQFRCTMRMTVGWCSHVFHNQATFFINNWHIISYQCRFILFYCLLKSIAHMNQIKFNYCLFICRLHQIKCISSHSFFNTSLVFDTCKAFYSSELVFTTRCRQTATFTTELWCILLYSLK